VLSVAPSQISFLRALAITALAVLTASTVSAQTLTWNANTEANLAGYRVEYGTVSGSPSTTVDVGRVTSRQFTGLQAGATYYFRVVAYNTSGQSSTPSAQVSHTVPGTPSTPAPTLTSVSPTSGPTAGGTTITLTGTNFVSGATVRVGGAAATSVSVASATRITARTPVGTAGARDVVVTNPSGQAATRAGAFTYTGAASATLTATSVSPGTGPTGGGTAITVNGTGFVSGAAILIGGTPATAVAFVSSTQLTARTPAKPAGGYSVQVRNPNGQTANTPVGFLYSGTSTPPPPSATPTADAVSPRSGPTTGGTLITVTGSNFVSGATIKIGGVAATGVTFVSSTRLTARTPARAAGGYPVQVFNPNGSWDNTSAGFLYVTGGSAATATVETAASVPAAEPITRYLAEGVESETMHTRLAIANPEDGDAHVQLTFASAEGATVQRSVDVPARSQRTIDLSTVPELAGSSFSTVVESDRVVAVDRRVTLDPAGRASTIAAAIEKPSATWFFAEGPTSGPFEQFYLVQNPGETDARVQIRYLPPDGGEPIVRTHEVAAHSRATIWVDREAPSLAATTVGAEITSLDGAPIVVERTVYTTEAGSPLARSGVTHGGITSLEAPDGTRAGAARWVIADADPGTGRQASPNVVVSNQGAATDVTVTLLFEDGPEATATFPVAAGAQLDVPLAQAFPAAGGRSFSILVEAADPAAALVVDRGRAGATRAAPATGTATRLP
jgi:hypothetical protein